MTDTPLPFAMVTGQPRRLRSAYDALQREVAQSAAYRARCLELPVLVRKCGLAATVSFLAADTKHRGARVLTDIEAVLPRVVRGGLTAFATSAATSLRDYLLVTEEIIAIAEAFALLAAEAEVREDMSGTAGATS